MSDLAGKEQKTGFQANKPKRPMPAVPYLGWVARGGKMSKLKARVSTWVLVFLKELGAEQHTCAVALPDSTIETCPASPQQRQRYASC